MHKHKYMYDFNLYKNNCKLKDHLSIKDYGINNGDTLEISNK